MKKKNRILVSVVLAILTSAFSSHAIENLRISVQASNVVLSWPSLTNENFIVEYRELLATNTPWASLASNYPAKAGTNWTTFTHSNIVVYPPPDTNGGGGGSFGGLPGFNSSLAANAQETLSAEDLLPYPWNPRYQQIQSSSLMSAQTLNVEGGGGPENLTSYTPRSMGFYRVVRTGLHLVGMTNGATQSGSVRYPLEAAILSTNRPHFWLQVDGLEPTESSVFFDASTGVWVAEWNTAFSANGIHGVSLQADLPFNQPTISSRTNSQTSTNDIMFETFTSKFGTLLWVYANLSVLSASYEIDIYGQTNDYIGSFTGSTTSGYISFTWNRYAGSVLRTDDEFTGVFTLTSGGGSLAASASKKKKYIKGKGGAGDAFVVAWAQSGVTVNTATRTENLMQQAVVNILGNPAADFTYDLSPGNNYDGGTFRATSANKSNFLATLANNYYGNFYWYGHGNPHAIGASGNYENNPLIIEEDELNQAFGTNRQDFRFVFLDGCDTGGGTLCETFGISREQVSKNAYNSIGLKPNAFMGATTGTKNPQSVDDHNARALVLTQFFSDWMNDINLNGALLRAQTGTWGLSTNVVIWGAYNLNRFYGQ